jgi:hypothetical protein
MSLQPGRYTKHGSSETFSGVSCDDETRADVRLITAVERPPPMLACSMLARGWEEMSCIALAIRIHSSEASSKLPSSSLAGQSLASSSIGGHHSRITGDE